MNKNLLWARLGISLLLLGLTFALVILGHNGWAIFFAFLFICAASAEN